MAWLVCCWPLLRSGAHCYFGRMPCGLQLPIITQWSSADPSPLQPLFYPSPRMLWWRRGVPLSLGRVIARFHSLSGRLWLALHQIRSSGYPPCPDTPAQPPPLSPHALLAGAVRCFCWPRCIQAPYYYHPASVPPVPITAAIQIWCQHTHTHPYTIFSLPNAFLRFSLFRALLAPCPLWRRRGVCPLRCCFAIRCIHILSATLYHSSTASLPSVQPLMMHTPTIPDDPAPTSSPHLRRRILCTYYTSATQHDAQRHMPLRDPRPLCDIDRMLHSKQPELLLHDAYTRHTHTRKASSSITASSPSAHGIIPASSLLRGTVLSARPPDALPLGLL